MTIIYTLILVIGTGLSRGGLTSQKLQFETREVCLETLSTLQKELKSGHTIRPEYSLIGCIKEYK